MLHKEKVFNFRNGLVLAARTKLDQFTQALNNYFNEKVVSLGIYSKNVGISVFNKIGSSSKVFNKAGISKVRNYIAKFLLKSAPYLGSTKTELIKTSQTVPDSLLEVEISSNYQTLNIDADEWIRRTGSSIPTFKTPSHWAQKTSAIGAYLSKGTDTNKVLNRYVQYLNYLFRKYKVPVCASVQFYGKAMEAELSTMYSDKHATSGFNPKVYLSSVVVFEHKRWIPIKLSSSRYLTKQEFEGLTDADFRELHGDGNSISWISIREDGLDTQGHEYQYFKTLAPDAHIVKYFDKVLTIINSLSRKNTYDLSAYTFRAAENS